MLRKVKFGCRFWIFLPAKAYKTFTFPPFQNPTNSTTPWGKGPKVIEIVKKRWFKSSMLVGKSQICMSILGIFACNSSQNILVLDNLKHVKTRFQKKNFGARFWEKFYQNWKKVPESHFLNFLQKLFPKLPNRCFNSSQVLFCQNKVVWARNWQFFENSWTLGCA